MWRPRESLRNSRIVSSCAPVRFFSTEMARPSEAFLRRGDQIGRDRRLQSSLAYVLRGQLGLVPLYNRAFDEGGTMDGEGERGPTRPGGHRNEGLANERYGVNGECGRRKRYQQ